MDNSGTTSSCQRSCFKNGSHINHLFLIKKFFWIDWRDMSSVMLLIKPTQIRRLRVRVNWYVTVHQANFFSCIHHSVSIDSVLSSWSLCSPSLNGGVPRNGMVRKIYMSFGLRLWRHKSCLTSKNTMPSMHCDLSIAWVCGLCGVKVMRLCRQELNGWGWDARGMFSSWCVVQVCDIVDRGIVTMMWCDVRWRRPIAMQCTLYHHRLVKSQCLLTYVLNHYLGT